jgi:serine/threonine protein kinase
MTSPDDKTVITQQTAGAERDAEAEREPAAGAPGDSDRTVVIQRPKPDESSQRALAAGVRLAEFEILGLIGEGGFGIVYLAYDTQLGRNVALKEYIPASLATRAGGARVTVTSERHADTFQAGLKSFINEARLLAQFDHHSLVKVFRFWEDNGTAYMVMPYYEGTTLRDTLRQMATPPDEAWLRSVLAPLVEALSVMHGAQCYHRDIAPDNILLLKGSGRPLLLDFGAARRVIGDMTQALTVILKPGYAPIEQYAEVPSLKQGPWTDVYALAAVVYFAVLGKTPPPSVGRLMSDSYVPLASAAAGRYSDTFLQAIDHALAVRPDDRPQSVDALASELGLARDAPHAAQTVIGNWASSPAESPNRASAATSSASTAAAQRPQGVQAGAAASTGETAGSSKRPITIAALAAVVIVVAAIGAWFALRPAATVSPAIQTVSKPPAPELAAQGGSARGPDNVPLIASTPTASNAAIGTNALPASAAQISSSAAGAAPVASALPPYTPGTEFDRIASLGDPAIHVTTSVQRTTARINKDYLQFRLTSNSAGYVYVFMADPDDQYLMLFPNQRDKNNAIAADQTLSLPHSSWTMLAGAPAGPNRFLVMVSAAPRDFSDAGLQSGEVFSALSTDAQREAAARRTASYSPFAGKARCSAGVTSCPEAFGASTFRVNVVSASK